MTDMGGLSENPLVSIIIPAVDRIKTLETSLASISGQIYKKLEVIVVDGKSMKSHLIERVCKKPDYLKG